MLTENVLPIPVVDVASPAIDDLRLACTAGGLFFAANHGVPDALIAEHFAVAREFFALDVTEKLEIDVHRSTCFRGYEAFGTQTIDDAAPGDLKEGFIMGPDLPPDHPHVVAHYPNTGSNLWPARPAALREHMERYVAAMNDLGRRIARLLARTLGVPEAYFSDMLHDPLTYSQMFRYPPVPAGERNDRFGAGAHVDWGMLTMLLQDDVGGLQWQGSDGSWHDVPPVPGTFVIILGEMMVRFTNGRYRSATHRVKKNVSGRSRYSMPTFFDPPYDALVSCVPTCVPLGAKPAFAACSVAEHMREMAVQTLSARPEARFGA